MWCFDSSSCLHHWTVLKYFRYICPSQSRSNHRKFAVIFFVCRLPFVRTYHCVVKDNFTLCGLNFTSFLNIFISFKVWTSRSVPSSYWVGWSFRLNLLRPVKFLHNSQFIGWYSILSRWRVQWFLLCIILLFKLNVFNLFLILIFLIQSFNVHPRFWGISFLQFLSVVVSLVMFVLLSCVLKLGLPYFL